MSAEKSAGDGKNAPEASDGIDPDEIGVAGGAVDGAAGQDDVVTGLELQSGLRGLARGAFFAAAAAALAARLLLFLSIFLCASCVAAFRARFVSIFDVGVKRSFVRAVFR